MTNPFRKPPVNPPAKPPLKPLPSSLLNPGAESAPKPIKVVLTGGPCGGKTTLALTVEQELGHQVLAIPEAASLIFNGGFPRRVTEDSRRYQQRAIYYVQRELEGLAGQEHPERLLICDRGSLDGLAYWPEHGKSFLAEVDSTENIELNRYNWIIHLDTAGEDHYQTTSSLRIESHAQAMRLNQKVADAWARHPQRFVINNTRHFVEKLDLAMNIIRRIIAGESYQKIKSQIGA